MRFSYYCGHYKPGTGGYFTEPAECTAEGETDIDIGEEDWEECGASMECPRCGASLSDGYGLERIV